jgi:hypothetical protein
MPIIGHLAENALVGGDEFRDGNESPATRNPAFLKYCIRQMPNGKRITGLRSDRPPIRPRSSTTVNRGEFGLPGEPIFILSS